VNLEHLYPRDPVARRRALIGDAVVAGLLVVFAVFALSIHDAVGDLGRMGRDIRSAGETLSASGRSSAKDIRDAFDTAADAGGSLPVVGRVGEPLRAVGDSLAGTIETQAVGTGEELTRSGRQGERSAARIAALAGWVTFLIPASLLLAVTLPPRLRQVRARRTI
jgi:hypothetical protein